MWGNVDISIYLQYITEYYYYAKYRTKSGYTPNTTTNSDHDEAKLWLFKKELRQFDFWCPAA